MDRKMSGEDISTNDIVQVSNFIPVSVNIPLYVLLASWKFILLSEQYILYLQFNVDLVVCAIRDTPSWWYLF